MFSVQLMSMSASKHFHAQFYIFGTFDMRKFEFQRLSWRTHCLKFHGLKKKDFETLKKTSRTLQNTALRIARYPRSIALARIYVL